MTISLNLLWLVETVFLLIIVIRVVAFTRRARVLIKSRLLADVRLFMREYWKWNHLRSNLSGFWLGLSAVGGYTYVLFLASRVADVSVKSAVEKTPVAAVVVILGLLSLVGYTIYAAVQQHHTTLDICDGLKALRLFRVYRDSIETVRSFGWMQEGIGAYLNLGLAGLRAISEDVVDRITEDKIKGALERFVAEAALEFAGRIALIGMTLYAVQGRFTLWP